MKRASLGLIHGFSGTPKTWDGVLASLSNQLGRNEFSLDVRRPVIFGHEGSDPGVLKRSFDEEAERLLDRITSGLPDKRIDLLCGYSLGGRLALSAALNYPQRILRLVLIGTHPGLDDKTLRDERRQSDKGWIDLIEKKGVDAFVDAWEALPLFSDPATDEGAYIQRHRQARRAHSGRGLIAALKNLGLAEMPPASKRLGRLTMPVRLVVGDRDQKFQSIANALLLRLPRARLDLIPNCAHDVPIAAFDKLATLLAEELRA